MSGWYCEWCGTSDNKAGDLWCYFCKQHREDPPDLYREIAAG